MKKLNKRKVIILILLTISLMILVKAFSNSKANKLIEMTAVVEDNKGLLKEEEIKIQAINEGNKGASITLPNIINGKIVSKYYVDEKEITKEEIKPENNIQAKPDSSTPKAPSAEKPKEEQKSTENKEQSNNNIEKTEQINNTENTENKTDETKNNDNLTEEETKLIVKATGKTIEKIPGDKLYLTEEETKNKKIKLKTDYEMKETKGEKLYKKFIENKEEDRKKELEEEKNKILEENKEKTEEEKVKLTEEINKKIEQIDNNIVTVEGYMPPNAIIKVRRINNEEVAKKAESKISEEAKIKVAYDIKIIVDGKEFEPTDFDENVEVIIKGEDTKSEETKDYKVLHIKEEDKEKKQEEKIEEINEIEVKEDKIKFNAKEFSTYAVVEEPKAAGTETASNGIQGENGTTGTDTGIRPSAIINAATAWTGNVATEYTYGSGTQQEPYLIGTGEELALLAQNVNNGQTYEEKYFQLIDDIDLGGNSWTPIGNENTSFRGVFDGAGHTIANGKIDINNMPRNAQESFGIFGSIGGFWGKTIIRNVEISGFNIYINVSGNTNGEYFDGNSGGINVGTLVGTLYKNAEIRNIICKSSNILDTNGFNIKDENFNFSVGGIVGNISNVPNDQSQPGQQEMGVIKNCYSNVGITLKTEGVQVNNLFSKKDGRAKYHTGGIVGTIVYQKKWPENCLYEGAISSKGYIGPIFGALTGETIVTDASGFKTYWNGNDAGTGLKAKNIFYSSGYRANNRTFNQSVTQGNSNVQIGTGRKSIEQVQGVNKGIYQTNMQNVLNIFNTEANTSNLYCSWVYQGGQFSFKERLTTRINENPLFTFNVEVTDPYNIGNYTYTWFKNGQRDPSIVGNKYVWPINYDTDEHMVVLTYDGTYYAANKFTIRRISVDIVFDINEPNRSVVARLEGEGMKYTTIDQYTFQWYKVDISGGDEIIPGETSLTLGNLEDYTEYKLVATNGSKPKLSSENSFIFKGRNVVYVNYNIGNDNNNGRTDRTPVRTYAQAYSKLETNAPREKNIIVVMGNYSENTAYNTETGAAYKKNATITGKYRGKEYNGELVLHDSGYSYRFLNGDTTFQYITLKGEGTSIYYYLQGYSLTIGEQVKMTGYSRADSRQGLLGNNAPAFHLIAGWLKYDETTLPRNNSKIIIKSGNYGRVLGGGSPGLSGASELMQERSHNFMGSSKEDSFNVEITVDIKNSTKDPKYDYDVNLLVGGSACGNNYSNVVENIKSGTVGRLLGGSIGDSSDRPEGTFWNPIEWKYPINTFLGTAKINVTGGTIAELYGGCLGRNMNALRPGSRGGYMCDSYFYGTSTINISGGEITNNIYGAGAGGVTGYHTTSSDQYKEAPNFPSNASPNSIPSAYNTEIDINITGGTVGGNIYGGGYGYTEYLTEETTTQDAGALYGNSNITIGGTAKIIGNVYGAGCGYNYGSKTELAKMIGTSTIAVEGTPNIQGQIFGAGQGVNGKAEMAKLDGTSNVTIGGNLNTQVYGGGNISKTVGTTNVNVNSGNHTQDIYGGGNKGIVNGTSNVTVNGGTSTRIFGGGNQATVTNSKVKITGGTNNQVFAGGNLAEVTNPEIIISGGKTEETFGGGNEASAGITKTILSRRNCHKHIWRFK